MQQSQKISCCGTLTHIPMQKREGAVIAVKESELNL